MICPPRCSRGDERKGAHSKLAFRVFPLGVQPLDEGDLPLTKPTLDPLSLAMAAQGSARCLNQTNANAVALLVLERDARAQLVTPQEIALPSFAI